LVDHPGGTVDNLEIVPHTGEQAAIALALKMWANVANISVSEDPNAVADQNNHHFKFLATDSAGMASYFGNNSKSTLGFSTLPYDISQAYGQPALGPKFDPTYAVYNQQGYGWTENGLQPGGYGFVTITHEIGHLFDLDHPFQEDGVNEPAFPGATGTYKTGDNDQNQGIFTTMTYNDGWTGQPSKSADWGYQMGPMAFDIAAMQVLYGANQHFQEGNNTYQLPQSNTTGTGWYCIWDTDGLDAISAGSTTRACTIDLRAATLVEGDPNAGGYVSWNNGVAGGFTIAHGVTIEDAIGGAGNDKLTGNEASNHLTGGAGADVLISGGGPDFFVYKSVDDARPGKVVETIQGFNSNQDPTIGDRIDFHDFRLPDGTPIHFAFLGSGALGARDNYVAELRFNDGVLTGDYNNDGIADIKINIAVPEIHSYDFLL